MSGMDIEKGILDLPRTFAPSHASLLADVRKEASNTARHLMHDHPVASVKRKQGIINIRNRGKLHLLPRLWHRKQVYAYFLRLYHPLWLGEDGVIYREYEDLCGNSYFLEAEIWLRDKNGLRMILAALHKIDPCNDQRHHNA